MNRVSFSRHMDAPHYVECISWLIDHADEWTEAYDEAGIVTVEKLREGLRMDFFIPGEVTVRVIFIDPSVAVWFRLKFG